LFTIYRQVLYWFNMNDEGQPFLDKKCPVYIWEFGDGLNNDIYGFPAIDGQLGGVKVASEQYQVSTSPDTVRRTVSEQEIKYMYANSIANRLQGLSPTCVRAVSCLYTVTPDHQFIIDRHPEHANVILVSPCSGHGFKHSAALGESVAEWVQDGRSKLDLSSFGLARFAE
jgi:sarcosine oxidase